MISEVTSCTSGAASTISPNSHRVASWQRCTSVGLLGYEPDLRVFAALAPPHADVAGRAVERAGGAELAGVEPLGRLRARRVMKRGWRGDGERKVFGAPGPAESARD